MERHVNTNTSEIRQMPQVQKSTEEERLREQANRMNDREDTHREYSTR